MKVNRFLSQITEGIALQDRFEVNIFFDKINLSMRGTHVIQATLPRAIRKSDKINTRFKIRLDI